MRTFFALVKKEVTGRLRTGTAAAMLAVFFVFGIMNPLIAKLTPRLLEAMSGSMAESGLVVESVNVDALTSWTQFFKNVPMALLVFVLMESTAFSKEYAAGTLTLVLTKGISRHRIVWSKSFVLIAEWTAGYWLHWGITLLYTEIYWNNSIAANLGISAFYWWLFGLFVTAVLILFSCVGNTSSAALLGTGATVGALFAASFFSGTKKFTPFVLTDGTALVYGAQKTGDFLAAAVVAAVLTAACLVTAAICFNKKKL